MCSNLANNTCLALPTHTLNVWHYDKASKSFNVRATLRKLGQKEVLIKTTHSGLCYTDVHAKGKGCGLGHEGVGLVAQLGSAVTTFAVGQRVGWGYVFA